jgi:Zn-dependent protease with chaperone function
LDRQRSKRASPAASFSFDAADSFSFVYGVMTPRVAVSRGLLERATGDELRAVLEHERYHVRNIDPLKAAIVRVLSEALFHSPAPRRSPGLDS